MGNLYTKLSFLCLKMAEIETFILFPWQLIYPSNHTQKLLFKSTVTSIPNLGLLHLHTEISLCCHGNLFPIATKITINSLVWFMECPYMKFDLYTPSNDQDIDQSYSSYTNFVQIFMQLFSEPD